MASAMLEVRQRESSAGPPQLKGEKRGGGRGDWGQRRVTDAMRNDGNRETDGARRERGYRASQSCTSRVFDVSYNSSTRSRMGRSADLEGVIHTSPHANRNWKLAGRQQEGVGSAHAYLVLVPCAHPPVRLRVWVPDVPGPPFAHVYFTRLDLERDRLVRFGCDLCVCREGEPDQLATLDAGSASTGSNPPLGTGARGRPAQSSARSCS